MGRVPAGFSGRSLVSSGISRKALGDQHRPRPPLRPNPRRPHPGLAPRCLRAGVESAEVSGPSTNVRQSWPRRLVSTQIPDCNHAKAAASSLRRNNPAHGVPPRQNDAAMIHFDRRCVRRIGNRHSPAPPARRRKPGTSPPSSSRPARRGIGCKSAPYLNNTPPASPPPSACPELGTLKLMPLRPPPVRLVAIDMDGTLLPAQRRKSVSATRRRSGPRRQRASQWPSLQAAARLTRLPCSKAWACERIRLSSRPMVQCSVRLAAKPSTVAT